MAGLIAIAAVGLFALSYGTWWLHRRFGTYNRLPHHFDIRGRPDAFGPPWMILRLLPAILGTALMAIIGLNVALYDPAQQGALLVGLLVASASMVAALALTGWLLVRWEKDGAKLDR